MVPGLHPIVRAIVIFGPYGAMYIGTTWVLGVQEARATFARVSRRR